MAKTARQIAASRANIKKAQAASAASRRGKKRTRVAGHHYGTGRAGRAGTRRAKYGSRKHGISPTQAARRKQRATKFKNAGRHALGVGLLAAAVYSDPGARAHIHHGAKRAKVKYQNAKTRSQFKKMMKHNNIKVR